MILKILGKVAGFQYKTAPQKNKGVSQKNQNKFFVKKRITKYFGGSDPMNELYAWWAIWWWAQSEHHCLAIRLRYFKLQVQPLTGHTVLPLQTIMRFYKMDGKCKKIGRASYNFFFVKYYLTLGLQTSFNPIFVS